MPDDDATYAARRTLDLSGIEPMIGLPDSLIRNAVPVSDVTGVPVNRAFIGSCANGTLDDLRDAARVLRGWGVRVDVFELAEPVDHSGFERSVARANCVVDAMFAHHIDELVAKPRHTGRPQHCRRSADRAQ